MFKQCKDCGEVKTLDLFPKNKGMSDGHVNSCKVCVLRDFLCTNCNRGLGHFQDSKDLLMKAVTYLEKHTENVDTQKEGRRL